MWRNRQLDEYQCDEVRKRLSEYVDNALPTARAWEVEKHLTACAACAEEARQMEATVQLLRSMPRSDTSDRFMAALHARLDTVDPSAEAGRGVWRRIQTWFSGAGASLHRNRVPALSLGLAAVAIAVVVTVRRPDEPVLPVSSAVTASDGVHASVASSASSPFSDPAADNLEYRLGSRSTGAPAPF